MSIYIEPEVTKPEDSEEMPKLPPQFPIFATADYKFQFESPDNLLGNASKITCKIC